MALNITCTIVVKDQAYEGGVKDGEAMSVTGFAAAAPGSFAKSGRETIEMMIDAAVSGAVNNAKEKLDFLKGKSEVTDLASSDRNANPVSSKSAKGGQS
jgi:hypothetical protein